MKLLYGSRDGANDDEAEDRLEGVTFASYFLNADPGFF